MQHQCFGISFFQHQHLSGRRISFLKINASGSACRSPKSAYFLAFPRFSGPQRSPRLWCLGGITGKNSASDLGAEQSSALSSSQKWSSEASLKPVDEETSNIQKSANIAYLFFLITQPTSKPPYSTHTQYPSTSIHPTSHLSADSATLPAASSSAPSRSSRSRPPHGLRRLGRCRLDVSSKKDEKPGVCVFFWCFCASYFPERKKDV